MDQKKKNLIGDIANTAQKDLVTFTEETLNGKLHFFWSVRKILKCCVVSYISVLTTYIERSCFPNQLKLVEGTLVFKK